MLLAWKIKKLIKDLFLCTMHVLNKFLRMIQDKGLLLLSVTVLADHNPVTDYQFSYTFSYNVTCAVMKKKMTFSLPYTRQNSLQSLMHLLTKSINIDYECYLLWKSEFSNLFSLKGNLRVFNVMLGLHKLKFHLFHGWNLSTCQT